MKNMTRILYVIHRCPYPPNKGDRIRSFNIIKYLSRDYDIKIVYPYFSDHDIYERKNLLKYCSYVKPVKINKIAAILNCIFGFFSKQPITNSYFKSRKIEDAINRIDFDIALVDCSSMAQYFMNRDVPKIIDFIDIDSEKWKLYAEENNFFKKYIYRREYIELKKVERNILKKFDKCIVISEQERLLIDECDISY